MVENKAGKHFWPQDHIKGLAFHTKEFGCNSATSISPGNLGSVSCTNKR